MQLRATLIGFALLLLAACSSQASLMTPTMTTALSTSGAVSTLADIQPFTPGKERPLTAFAPSRPLTAQETATEAALGAELTDPRRPVFLHYLTGKRAQNVVGAGNGEAVGMFTSGTFAAQGSVTNIGVQLNYLVENGGNFYHTHQFPNNQCFEYGINYSATAPTLFGYNWCTGGNTPQGFLNIGLVGYPGGVLNTWSAAGNGWLLAWDTTMSIYKIALEEVQESDGWHLLGYNWKTLKFYDLMNGFGVTGTKNACCGWAVMEEHNAPGASCAFDPTFPKGTHLLYDFKKQVLVGKVWETLDKAPGAGITGSEMIDCVDISTTVPPSYTSPYFSGVYENAPATTSFGPMYAGSFWLTQR